MRRPWAIIVGVALLSIPAAVLALEVHSPRCEYLENPLGIDAAAPGLGWVVASDRRGDGQTAYQVLVASTPDLLARDVGDLWDSGRVESDRSVGVVYAGTPLRSRMRCHWKVRAWDKEGKPSPWSRPSLWTMGLLGQNDWKGCWIGARAGKPSGVRRPFVDGDRAKTGAIDPADAPAVLLRRQATFAKRPVRATAFLCGLGYYELFINGRRVGDRVLDPAFTDYMRRVLYATYDVTELVRSGENVFGVVLGNGFYCLQTPDLFQLEKAPWRTPPRMRFNLVVEFDDGSESTLASDGQWKCSTGPIRFNCIRGGETIDARQDPGPWLEPGFDDAGWRPAVEVAPPLGKLAAQAMPPIRITDRFSPRAITEPTPGVFVADFGRNLAGWVRWTTSGSNGQRVTLDYNEALQKDGTLDKKFQATHTYGRYQHQECVLSGAKNDVFEPRFTYHGFRYVELRGLDRPPKPEDLTACRMHTDLKHAGGFACSDPILNCLHDAGRRTLEDCTWGAPTAEPVREKVAWLGDDNFEIDAYFYLFDAAAVYRKHVQDMIDAQEPNGHFGSVIPAGGWGELGPRHVGPPKACCDSPWWSISLAICADRLRTDYGDRRTERIAYEACRRYTDFLTSTADKGIVAWGLGDWIPRSGVCATNSPFTSTAAYYHQAKLVAAEAARLGKKNGAAKYDALARSIKEAFNRRFLASGVYGRNAKDMESRQTAQSLPLALGLMPTPERNRVFETLVRAARADGDRLTAGFIGTMPTLYALTDGGHGDLAYEMVKEGWSHMLGNGDASTLGESPYSRHIALVSGHHQFGACVVGWMYRCLAGIRPDPAGPGYQRFTIKPAMVGGITWVKSHYDSVHGRIESNWRRDADGVTMEITVPASTRATVHVPAKEARQVTESGRPVSEAEGVAFRGMADGSAVLELASGTYRFRSESQVGRGE